MDRYKTFSTTGDVGIEVFGNTLEEIYQNAVDGLQDLVFGENIQIRPAQTQMIHHFAVKGDSPESILVNLLTEITFLIYNQNQITNRMEIHYSTPEVLDATMFTTEYYMEPEIEIKSITYHNLQIKEKDGRKTARILCDV